MWPRLADSFTVGNIITVAVVVGAILRFETRVAGLVRSFLVEHEILIADYCKRTGVKADDLPTRLKGLLRGGK